MKKLVIDNDECIGCFICVDLCPTMFESIDGNFVPTPVDCDVTNIRCAIDVVDLCPVEAMSIK